MLRRTLSSLLGLIRVRFELAGVELQDELDYAVRALAMAAAGGLLFAIGWGFAAMAVIVALWDTHRILAITSFAIVFIVAGAGLLLWLIRLSRNRPPMFSETAAQFEEDRRRLGARH